MSLKDMRNVCSIHMHTNIHTHLHNQKFCIKLEANYTIEKILQLSCEQLWLWVLLYCSYKIRVFCTKYIFKKWPNKKVWAGVFKEHVLLFQKTWIWFWEADLRAHNYLLLQVYGIWSPLLISEDICTHVNIHSHIHII